jgi:hypothetical protein
MKRLPLILVIAALAGAAAIAYGPARASYARGSAR